MIKCVQEGRKRWLKMKWAIYKRHRMSETGLFWLVGITADYPGAMGLAHSYDTDQVETYIIRIDEMSEEALYAAISTRV